MAIKLDALMMMMMMMKTLLLHKNPSWQLLPITPQNPRPPQVDPKCKLPIERPTQMQSVFHHNTCAFLGGKIPN
jgi:hypothetical protein